MNVIIIIYFEFQIINFIMIKSQDQLSTKYFQMIHISILPNLFILLVIESVHPVLLSVSGCFQILFLVALFFMFLMILFVICIFLLFLFGWFGKISFILLRFWLRITLIVLVFYLIFVFLDLLFLIFIPFRNFNSFGFINYFINFQFDHVMILSAQKVLLLLFLNLFLDFCY